MLRALFTFVTFALIGTAIPEPATAQNRHALVIGVDDYTAVPRLERAVADARAMARTLGELGFKVRLVENPDRSALSAAFGHFREGIETGDTAFVFFAGHGMEIDGQNLLLARDAPDPNQASQDQVRDAGFLTVSLIERVTRQGARAAFFVFDACRNNPYASRAGRRSIGSTRGLARQEAPEGVFVLMSAGHGQEALDSLNQPGRPARDTDANSIFTRVLVDELRRPGVSHIELAKSVQQRVRDLARSIDHAQLPAFYDQIIGNVVFRPGTPVVAAPAIAPPPLPAPPPGPTPDEVTWAFIKDTTQAALIEQFLARFPQSAHRREAEARLAELRRLASAAPAPPLPPPTPLPPPPILPHATPFLLKSLPPPPTRVEPAPPSRSWLGTEFTANTPDDAEALGLGTPRGMRIVRVIEGSPAARAGLKLQDVIFSANGKTLSVLDELRDLVASTPPGQALDLVVFRDRQEIRVRVTLALIDDEARWSMVKSSGEVALLEQFIADFPQSSRRRDAEARLAELEKERLAAVAPPPAPPPASAAPLAPTAERNLKPKDTFLECPACPEMVVAPAGAYLRGSPPGEKNRETDEGPQRRVTIAKPFAVGKFEITFDQWDACIADGGCENHRPKDHGFGRGRQPVIGVSWRQAQSYVAWLSRKTGKSYRLLTEAEWEYAARAGTTTPFAFGATITPDDANYEDGGHYASGRPGANREKPLPVGAFRANAFGLHDMHGNVGEWVEDCYRANYDRVPTDGAAFQTSRCEYRVARGGNWNLYPSSIRSAARDKTVESLEFRGIGFRVARTLAQ